MGEGEAAEDPCAGREMCVWGTVVCWAGEGR